MAPLNPTNEIIRQVWVGAGPHGDGVVGRVGHGQSLHCHVVRILTGTIRGLVALSTHEKTDNGLLTQCRSGYWIFYLVHPLILCVLELRII